MEQIASRMRPSSQGNAQCMQCQPYSKSIKRHRNGLCIFRIMRSCNTRDFLKIGWRILKESSQVWCDGGRLTVLGIDHGAEGARVLLAEEGALSAQEHVAHHQRPLKAHPLPPPKPFQR